MKRRGITVVTFLALVIAAVALFAGDPHQQTVTRDRSDTIKNVLTDKNTREVGIDALSADVKLLSRENQELKKSVERINSSLSNHNRNANSIDLDQEIQRLRGDMALLTKQNLEMAKKLEHAQQNTGQAIQPQNMPAMTEDPLDGLRKPADSDWLEQSINVQDPNVLFSSAPQPEVVHPVIAAPNNGSASTPGTPQGIKIVSYTQTVSASSSDDTTTDQDALYLPAGSILTGVLINGMDAPTAQGARRDPFPSTLRIQKEAILPNRFRADVRECFLIVSGYGDLSAERAYLRGETIACVREDGGVIEAALDSYVVGEDGKAGVRGRVVSKQGQIIAKSLMAGFLSGVSEAFDVNPVPVVSTNPGSTTQYQDVFSSDLLQGAGVKGASNALDRIAQFYIDMAEGIFPVIEIDAGRQLDIIMTKGTKLNIRTGTSSHE